MRAHGIPEATKLEFLDEYPRVTIRLPEDRGVLYDLDALASCLSHGIETKSGPN
jgi:hypothetical protein